MKIALVYDRINKFGGAERVLQALHELWPEAPLYTSVYHQRKAPWAKNWTIKPSFLNRLPFLRDKHEWLAPLMPYAFEAFDLSAYDIVLSVTSAEAKGILTSSKQLHLCYLLTPTRYLWSHTHAYLKSPLKRLLFSPFISRLRRWDYVAATRPDYFIPISQAVAKRCRKYYRREPEPVIYPPVATHQFAKHPLRCVTTLRDYFLVVSRPVGYKQIDLVKAAFQTYKAHPLVIVGGPRAFREGNIWQVGPVTDEALACYYHHARALIFPQEEDFGLVAVEAQAAGIPVIAYSRGGALETVAEGVSGLFFSKPTVASLLEALTAFDSKTWYDKLIRQQSQQFNQTKFIQAMRATVEGLWERHQRLR